MEKLIKFNNIVLIQGHHLSGTFEFDEADSLELFQANLKSQPLDWRWRTESIKYTYNNQGYRALEWDRYDWNNSIIIFGCSTVFGTGVKFSETIGEQLSNLCNIPVINLGRGGSGTMYHWANSVNLRKSNISPRAVVYVWPDSTRCLEFKDTTGVHVNSWGAWDSFPNFGASWVMHESHGDCYRNYVIDNCDLLWNCPVYHFSRFPINNATFLPPGSDTARDLIHPGPITLSSWAQIIYERISI